MSIQRTFAHPFHFHKNVDACPCPSVRFGLRVLVYRALGFLQVQGCLINLSILPLIVLTDDRIFSSINVSGRIGYMSLSCIKVWSTGITEWYFLFLGESVHVRTTETASPH
jgi:hypothetical protein